MNKVHKLTVMAVVISFFWSCSKDSKNSPPPSAQPPPQPPQELFFTDMSKADLALVDLYTRQEDFTSLVGDGTDPGWKTMTDFSESFPSENASLAIVQRTSWPFNSWALDWTKAFAYIKDLNLFLYKDSLSVAIAEGDRIKLMAEAKFLRANIYFELVKRMGGVPIIVTDTSKTDRQDLKLPRAKESDVYDFIIQQAETIKLILPADGSIKTRITKGAALAMESRAALYAGSISKYGATSPSVSLPGGEVGISVSKSSNYYSIALRAAQEIINGQAGFYSLYQSPTSSSNLAANFAQLFIDKYNTETILVQDVVFGQFHSFTRDVQPFSLTDEPGTGGRLNPSLNLAESFEKLDNSFAPLPSTDNAGNTLFYTNLKDIFSGRDARLAGTFLLPGDNFRTGTVDIWAGYLLADGSILTSDNASNLKPLTAGGTPVQVVGNDGPVNGLEFRTQTGFYLRKYLDPTFGAGKTSQGSSVSYIRYRYGELLLNAAEAAFELGQPNTAAQYMNLVRARAGLITPLTSGEITFRRIVHERRVELAFEGHYLFDMKRWRLATSVWNGQPTTSADLKTNMAIPTAKSTQPWGLWPYKYYNPSSPLNGKWIFRETLPAAVTGTNFFANGNYYSAIPADIIAQNPLIVQQPNQ